MISAFRCYSVKVQIIFCHTFLGTLQHLYLKNEIGQFLLEDKAQINGYWMKVDKDVAESGNPTCDSAALARMASPVGGGVAGGIREKTRWLRPLFHNG